MPRLRQTRLVASARDPAVTGDAARRRGTRRRLRVEP